LHFCSNILYINRPWASWSDKPFIIGYTEKLLHLSVLIKILSITEQELFSILVGNRTILHKPCEDNNESSNCLYEESLK
jgi:hypothetical protein